MTHLVPIGNSFGVRIPKAILSQLGFDKNSNLNFQVVREGLLITPIEETREGWEEAFKKAKKSQKKEPLFGKDIVNDFDLDEWEW